MLLGEMILTLKALWYVKFSIYALSCHRIATVPGFVLAVH